MSLAIKGDNESYFGRATVGGSGSLFMLGSSCLMASVDEHKAVRGPSLDEGHKVKVPVNDRS